MIALLATVTPAAKTSAAVGQHAATTPGMFGAVFTLLLVLGLIIGLGWLLKRYQFIKLPENISLMFCRNFYQLFDDSCRHSSCPFVTVFLFRCQHGHSISLFYHHFGGIEPLFMNFLFFVRISAFLFCCFRRQIRKFFRSDSGFVASRDLYGDIAL